VYYVHEDEFRSEVGGQLAGSHDRRVSRDAEVGRAKDFPNWQHVYLLMGNRPFPETRGQPTWRVSVKADRLDVIVVILRLRAGKSRRRGWTDDSKRPTAGGLRLAVHYDEPGNMGSGDEARSRWYEFDTANCKLGTGNSRPQGAATAHGSR
jgi:hypothetical protein